MNDADRVLHQICGTLVRTKRFSATNAASSAVGRILKLDGLKKLDIPNTLPFVMDGLKYRAKQYRPAEEDGEDAPQTDFSRLDSTFARLIYAPVALDEAPGTRRLPPIEMTLPELRQHIALKERKAAQTQANAEILARYVDTHPEWEKNPEWTLRQVIDRERGEPGDVA
jgi:hypothetical protein